ncbi:nuclear transport factor 2 family protein [Actinoplanes sp. NPDC023936]|uniref:nuclear transport factor 2 family protein n=1 Tax=Actinoplanes sp. NPDC023936 TaxID=3154910 RepID=UPI00340D8936
MNLRTFGIPMAATGVLLAGRSDPAPVPSSVDAPGVAPSPSAVEAGTDADETAILQAGRARTQAMIGADTNQLGELLADDFTAVHITGYEQSKADWLEQVSSGETAYHDVQEQSASVAVDGDTAVLTSRNLVTATINGSRGTWPLESTTTYARIDGNWLATRSRSTTY